MPQLGERRSGATETVEWNGQRWVPVTTPAAPQEEGALSRFFNGALSTSPLNPMNYVRAAQDLPGTIGGMVVDPLVNLFKGLGDIKATVTGERGDRLSSAVQAIEHLGGAVPFIGPAGIKAGEKIGSGDIAGGAGELTGLASAGLLPKVLPKVPGAITKTGEVMEKAGTGLQNVKLYGTPLAPIGMAEALYHGSPGRFALSVSPYALEYGGKGVAAAGRALEGLRTLRGAPEKPTWDPAGPSRRAAADAAQQAARERASGVNLGDEGTIDVTDKSYVDEPVYSEFQPKGSGEAGASGYSPEDLQMMRELSDKGYSSGAIRKIVGANEGDLEKFTREGQKPEVTPEEEPINGSYGRPKITSDFFNRAEDMGRNSLATLRNGGYDVPEGGFRSTQDIDRLNNGSEGPLEVDLTDQLGGNPMSPLERLAARAAERYGRRFRPEQ